VSGSLSRGLSSTSFGKAMFYTTTIIVTISISAAIVLIVSVFVFVLLILGILTTVFPFVPAIMYSAGIL
jgi:hypothetical protein